MMDTDWEQMLRDAARLDRMAGTHDDEELYDPDTDAAILRAVASYLRRQAGRIRYARRPPITEKDLRDDI